MRKSWAANLLPLFCLLAGACSRPAEPPSTPKSPAANREVDDGWMGRYGRRDEGLRVLLSSQEGWGKLRDMELPDAVELFKAGSSEADRVGAGRAYLALASLHEALAELHFCAESKYADALGPAAKPDDLARGGLAKLLRGDLPGAKTAFQHLAGGSSPLSILGEAGIAAAEGRRSDADALARNALSASSRTNRDAIHVACLLWGLPCPEPIAGSLSGAENLRRKGNPEGALRLLRDADTKTSPKDAALFRHLIYRRVYGALALAALPASQSVGGALESAQAKEHQGDDAGAAELYGRWAEAKTVDSDPSWLFSPITGSAEGARLALVLRGAALYRLGQNTPGAECWKRVADSRSAGPLVTAALSVAQVRQGQKEPYADPAAMAFQALGETRAYLESQPKQDASALLPTVFAARISEVSRLVSQTLQRQGNNRAALDVLERAHRKAAGYRPDFVNPPAFFVDLARAYVNTGEYATAVAILYELSRQYPAASPTYESVKRLYATQAGGGAAPKY